MNNPTLSLLSLSTIDRVISSDPWHLDCLSYTCGWGMFSWKKVFSLTAQCEHRPVIRHLVQIRANSFYFQRHKGNSRQTLLNQCLKETTSPSTCSILPLLLPHLHPQSLPSCQSAVLESMGVVAAGFPVPGKIILDWLPSLLLLLWRGDKMLMGPNVFDTKGETACSRHGASCHPFSSCTGWILPVQFCLLKRT